MARGRPQKRAQPVGERILRNYGFLKRLATTRSDHRRIRQLASATPDQLLAVVEASANVLEGVFCLNRVQLQRIMPYRDALNKLARVRSERGARRTVTQYGGGVPALFAALLSPILVDAAHHLIKKVAGSGSEIGEH